MTQCPAGAWNNNQGLRRRRASGAIDAGKALYQLGYDTFYGASPFADEQTQAETKARAEARGDLIKNPGKLIDAVKAPYEQDINSGHDGRAAGRAVLHPHRHRHRRRPRQDRASG